jgi:hypothetical protein
MAGFGESSHSRFRRERRALVDCRRKGMPDRGHSCRSLLLTELRAQLIDHLFKFSRERHGALSAFQSKSNVVGTFSPLPTDCFSPDGS